MKSRPKNWLEADGWIGIIARVTCELLFFVFVLNAMRLASWLELVISGRTLIIDPKKEWLLDRAAVVFISIGLVVEAVNVIKLLIARRQVRDKL